MVDGVGMGGGGGGDGHVVKRAVKGVTLWCCVDDPMHRECATVCLFAIDKQQRYIHYIKCLDCVLSFPLYTYIDSKIYII